MEDYYQLVNTLDWQTIILLGVDKILYAMYFIAVFYLFIFSLASLINRKKRYSTAKKQHTFAVYFFNNHTSDIIVESVKSFLNQDYPREKYEIFAITSDKYTQVNKQLEQIDVKLIITNSDEGNKPKELQRAIALTEDKLYDVAVIMNADNSVEANYLTEVNDAYYSGGMAIQTHRTSKDTHTDTALFGAISEEINNSIFRLGHVNLGLSSALIDSGIVLNFSWLKKNIASVTLVDTVKQLETMLLEQSIFIEYLNYVHVYGNKANKVKEFYQQRTTWYKTPLIHISNTLYKLPKYLLSGNYDYCDKLFQWLIPSRMILFGTLILIPIILFFLSWGLAIKWLFLLLILIITFSIATPDYFINARFIKAMRSAPILITITIVNALKRKINPSKNI